jgi:uncharacterized protein (TIRG00374 family)
VNEASTCDVTQTTEQSESETVEDAGGNDREERPTTDRRWSTLLRSSVAGASGSQLVIAAVVAAGAIVLGVMHHADVHKGSRSLAGADVKWMVLAMAATAAIWIACTATQLGSMPMRPPLGRVFAVQVAASFANQLLPAGSGGIAINVRFLQRHGMSRGAAAGAVGLNSLAGLVTHLILLVAAVAADPTVLGRVGGAIDWDGSVRALRHMLWIPPTVIAVLLVVGFVFVMWRRRNQPADRKRRTFRSLWKRGVRELKALKAVASNPPRALALWLGSSTVPLLHSLILFAMLRAIGEPVSVGTVVVLYLVVSTLSAVLPSPGGFGSLDVTLVTALAAAGVGPAHALGAVLGYRLVTVWLPLVPGAFVLAFLLRRRII